jgi:hypothetical protein
MAFGPWIFPSFVLGQVVVGICAMDNNWIGFGAGLARVAIGWLSTFTPDVSLGCAINCLELYEKYATEGVRLQGTVLKMWDVEITDDGGRAYSYYVEVLYQVGDLLYKREFSWTADGYRYPPGRSIFADPEAEPPTWQPIEEGSFGCLPMPATSS